MEADRENHQGGGECAATAGVPESSLPAGPGGAGRPAGQRIHFMDEVRGFDIILMVFFHAFYTIGYLFNVPWGQALFRFFQPSEAFFAGVFVFICGISCRLSHSNWKRGGLLLLVAAGISAVLWVFMRSEMIWFGILHFLAVAILLFALLRPLLDRIPPAAGLAACAALLLLTWWVPAYKGGAFGIPGLFSLPVPDAWQGCLWLYPLGLSESIPAGDYFPLLPWIFCFLAGSFAGVWAKAGRFPRWMYTRRVPFFSWIGKHTLVIYVVHQPVIYGICLAIYTISKFFAAA